MGRPRNNYVFLTPYTYAWDVLTVIAPLWAWSEIDLDGLPLPPATMLPGNPEYGYQTLLVEDGAHVLNSPYAGVGIEVYGYDCRLSYAYAGGLSLATINEVPDP